MSSKDLPIQHDPFPDWLNASEERHFANLTFPEVRRGVQALSRTYVEERGTRIPEALSGAGKRAAFAFFHAALHFMTIREIVRQLEISEHPTKQILDLGCGTGVGGAAWALEANRRPTLVGIERNPWAADEARWTYRSMGLRGSVRTSDLERVRLPGRGSGILLAYTANELSGGARVRLAERLLDAASRGAGVLVVEPIARKLIPWWEPWTARFLPAGGTVREWRVQASLPESLKRMDRAAGLDHRELTARSMWLKGSH